jgi:hypothetical protein
VKDQMMKVGNLILLLDQPGCNPKPVAARPPASARTSAALKAGEDHRAEIDRLIGNLTNRTSHKADAPKECLESVQDALNSIGLFDDYQFMLTLPVRRNVFLGTSIAEIEDGASNIDDRKFVLGQYVFRHWIERPNQIRCRLYFECLGKAALERYSQKIAETFSSNDGGFVLGSQCGSGAFEQIVHVKAGYDVFGSDAARDSRPTAYTLWTQDVASGTRVVQLSDIMVDAPTQRLTIKSRTSPFDIVVRTGEGIGYYQQDLGTCVGHVEAAQFRFMDSGEAAPRYNTVISLKALMSPSFP